MTMDFKRAAAWGAGIAVGIFVVSLVLSRFVK